MRCLAISRIALVCAAALAVAACKNATAVFQDQNEGGWFSKPMDVFAKPSWASATADDKNIQLSRGPVASDELVGADGHCSAPAADAAPPTPAVTPAPPPERLADRPVGSMAGDLASAPMPAAPPASANPTTALPDQLPGAPQVMGGIALGMSECDVVRRAGLASNVNISAGNRGERKVVLTYLSGTWPGIYTFDAGRLKVVDRAPVPETPIKPPAKTKKAKKTVKPKTATREIDRAFVQ
ncbi:MAG TPA: hypothetical protein VLN61_00735 [Pseudolabrys sp.]|nr:hypothetical protein [Pseudolabrys sp.]